MLRHSSTTSHRREDLSLGCRPSRLFRHAGAWARWVRLRGPFGPQPRLGRPPCRRANSPRILPYHVHTPPCRALWITRGRFHRRQMRQSWASPIVFIAARPLPDGTTWDESRQGIGTAMYGPLFPLLHPDHWVPTTSIKLPLPHPPTKDPVLHQGPLGGFSASSMIEVYPN